MQATIITIGDEILIGQILDSNSAFIAQELNKIGIAVAQINSIADTDNAIKNTLALAEKQSDIIIITGGLGPTKDDITKKALCDYYDDTMVYYPKIEEHIKAIFKQYNLPYITSNKHQAEVPSKATVLFNDYGTAPGMWFQENNKIVVSLPGVPFEMKNLISEKVIPKLQKELALPYIMHKTLVTYGKGESQLAQEIEVWENALPEFIKLAYLPSYGRVRLRLSGYHTDERILANAMGNQTDKLMPYIAAVFVGFDDEDLVHQLKDLLNKERKTLAVAESFTGGQLAGKLTSISGSSSYFVGGVVAYATRIKEEMLGVDKKLIEQHSVVSHEVAKAMALGVQKKLKADYAIATTGNAGPTKGDSQVEVGTVFIAIASPDDVKSYEYNFGQPREKVVKKAINEALYLLIKKIKKKD